jgi:hypothetical protein
VNLCVLSRDCRGQCRERCPSLLRGSDVGDGGLVLGDWGWRTWLLCEVAASRANTGSLFCEGGRCGIRRRDASRGTQVDLRDTGLGPRRWSPSYILLQYAARRSDSGAISGPCIRQFVPNSALLGVSQVESLHRKKWIHKRRQ